MLLRIAFLLFASFVLSASTGASAQEVDYLRHNKFFYLCSFKRECSHCYDCGKQRYQMRIKNRTEKRITGISYVFYSDVYNKVLTKEAKIQGDVISKNRIGMAYICVPEGLHWAISRLDFEDGSSQAFVVKERLQLFMQEPDECDCNE